MIHSGLEPAICGWCGSQYHGEFNATTEQQHLSICPVHQTLPAVEIIDGKEYIQYPDCPGLLVERICLKTNSI